MRNRLVGALVAMVVGVVLLYGVPRAYALADLVRGTEQRQTHHSAELVAVAVAERESGSAAVTPDFLGQLLRDRESIEYVAADGTRVRVGLPIEADSDADIVAVRPLTEGGQVTVRQSASVADDRVSDALLPLIVIGLVLAVIASMVTWVLAARLSRPFRELADVAESIGQGRFDRTIPRYRIAEAEAIADALRRGSERWAALTLRERDITANASHELRTPISALRAEIEDLASWPQTPAAVSAELRSYLPQLDRLSRAVRTYLDEVQSQRLTDVDSVDLVQMVRCTLERWRSDPDTARLQPELVTPDEGPVCVRAAAATVSEILDHLLQDALHRGATQVRIELDRAETYGQVRLSLQGELKAGDPGPRAAATRTAVEVDGRVSIVDGRSTLLLPRTR